MAEVNAAWEVLGDPLRRSEHDGVPRPRPAPRAPRAGSPPPRAGPGSTRVASLAALAGAAPWLALLGLVLGIFVFTAYAGSDQEGGEVRPVPTVAVRDLRGSCIQLAGGFTLVVDCLTVPNEGRIVAQASLGAACPAGTDTFEVPQQGVLACTEPTGR